MFLSLHWHTLTKKQKHLGGWDLSVWKGELYPLNDSRLWGGSSKLIQPRSRPDTALQWNKDLPHHVVGFGCMRHTRFTSKGGVFQTPALVAFRMELLAVMLQAAAKHTFFWRKSPSSYLKTCRIDPVDFQNLSELIAHRIASFGNQRGIEKKTRIRIALHPCEEISHACMPTLEALLSVWPSPVRRWFRDSSNQV